MRLTYWEVSPDGPYDRPSHALAPTTTGTARGAAAQARRAHGVYSDRLPRGERGRQAQVRWREGRWLCVDEFFSGTLVPGWFVGDRRGRYTSYVE